MKEKRESSKNWKKMWGIFLLTMIVTLTFFYLLYYFNNKYTAKEEKAIHGILYINGDYDSLPVYYLSREWEYYPGVLLTPKDDPENYYLRYLSIGEYGGMELDDHEGSPYGSGTYRLKIMLPKEEHTYGLYLPEIFSAYNLYINGSLEAQVGNPDPAHYKEQIQNRMFTFKGMKEVEILIAVTDKNSASPGMPYIPAFGNPLKVNTIRGIPLFIDSAVFTLVSLVLLFSIWTFRRTGTRANALFAGVCICVLGYTCYPLLHIYVPLTVQPWYGLEMLFYLMMFPMMLLLADEVTGRVYRWVKWTALFTAAAGILAAIAGIFAGGMETPRLAYGISEATELLKWFTASCLVVLAFFAAGRLRGKLLLVGTVVYASSLMADRIWPLYDPVFGGWFPEWGGIFLSAVFGMMLWQELTEGYRMRLLYEEQTRQMELRLMMQKEHYEKMTEALEEAGRTRHDMRQYIRTASMLLEEKHYDQLQEYFHQFARESTEKMQAPVCYTRNMSVDAILHYYAEQLKQCRARFLHTVEVPEKTGISDLDMCRILGNLLENAVNAVAEDRESKERYVNCVCKVKKGKLLINVENTFGGEVRKSGDTFYSTSHSGRGIGTASVCKTAEKYGGYADFSVEGHVFQANVFIPLKTDSSDRPF